MRPALDLDALWRLYAAFQSAGGPARQERLYLGFVDRLARLDPPEPAPKQATRSALSLAAAA